MDKAVTDKIDDKVTPWLSFSEDQYQKAFTEMFHHSFKITNSNIKCGGVRVSLNDGIKLPYISVRTLLGHDQPVLTDTAQKGSKIHKQINDVANGVADLAPLHDHVLIQNLLFEFRTKSAVKCNSISPRLRQILLPTDSGYLSITPLSSAGISVLLGASISRLKDRVDVQNADKNNVVRPLIKIKRASLMLGGSRPDNVGNLTIKTRYPMVAEFPTANNNIRHALSFHFKGVPDPKFPYSLVSEYISWRNKKAGQTDTNRDARIEHEAYLARFTRYWLGLGADAYDILSEHRNDLPSNDQLFSENVSYFDNGLIDSTLRNNAWRDQFSSRLAKKVAHLETDNKRRYEYSQNDISTITKIVKGILL